MALHPAKENALLAWINGLKLHDPVESVSHLQDGQLLLKLVYKLKGEESSQAPVHLPQAERLSIISKFLNSVCLRDQGLLFSEDFNGNALELQLTKVALLLCYCGVFRHGLVPKVEFQSEMQMATMFRYIEHEANRFSLSPGLDKLLTTRSLINCSSSSETLSSDDWSPVFMQTRSPLVSFLQLRTVASSSSSSPVQDVMNTPKIQLKRLRAEMAREGDVRDELERELAERNIAISEKEGQISQLQHRLQRLQRDQEELESNHKAALQELQLKNEGLLNRVHEVLRQCQDLKTDNSQKDRKIDETMEENGILAAQVRTTFAQLTRAEEEVAKLMQTHESCQVEWGSRRETLQKELSQALTDRECLSEQIQILQGKISVLEDELSKLSVQLQEKGEVLGPVMETEKLKQELSNLTLKLSQLEETISCLEKEKRESEMLFQKQEEKAHEMLAELETLSRELRKLKQQKLDAESCIERLKEEGKALADSLSDERHQAQSQLELLRKAKDETDHALQSTITEHQNKISQLQFEIEQAGAALKQSMSELFVLKEKISSKDEELKVQQQKIACLEAAAEILQKQLLQEQGNSQQLSQVLASKDNEVQEFKRELDLKEGEIQSLKVSIQSIEAKSTEICGHLQKDIEEKRLMVSDLKSKLVETERLISGKDKALEDLGGQLKDLKEQLCTEKERASTLDNVFKASNEDHEIIEQNFKLEVAQLRLDIDGHLKNLEQLLAEIKSLKEELSQQQDTVLQKEKEAFVLDNKHKALENDFAQLQNQLVEATALATENQTELLFLKKEAEHQENLRAQALEMEKTQRKELEREVSELQAKVNELSNIGAEREKVLASLNEKIKEQEDLKQKHLQESKEALQRELGKVLELKGQLDSVTHQVVAKTELLESTEEKIKQMELLCQQKESLSSEASWAKEMLEKTMTDLCTKQKQEMECYQLEVETLKKEKEQLSHSLQTTYQNLQVAKEDQQVALDALKSELQNTQEGYQKDMEALKNEMTNLSTINQSLLSECQSKQAENKVQQETINSLKSDLQETQEKHQKDLEILNKETEHTSSINKSLQNECHSLQVECKDKEEALSALTADLQNTQDKYNKEEDAWRKEKEHLSSVNLSLKQECQNLQSEIEHQKDELNVLKTDLQKDQDGYKQDLETIIKENECLSSNNLSLQTECQNLRAEKMEQQVALDALKSKLQNTQEGYQKDLEALKNEMINQSTINQSLLSECQSKQAENKVQQETINSLKSDLQETQEKHQKDLEILNKETEHTSSINKSLQNECHSLQVECKDKEEALSALTADLQNTQDKYNKEEDAWRKEKEHLSSVNLSLKQECQNLRAEKMEQQVALDALKSELQNTQEGYQKDLEALKNEMTNLSTINQSLLSECQSKQAENKVQQETINSLKSDLQETQEKHQKDLEILNKETEHTSSINKSLQNECHSLQVECKDKEEALSALKADLQNTQDKYNKEEDAWRKEKEHLSSVNLSLKQECQNLQSEIEHQKDELNVLKTDLQKDQDGYKQDLETIIKENECLSSNNLSLQTECQNLRAEKMEQQNLLDALKADLKNTRDGFQKEVQALQKEKEHLCSLNQTLRRGCDASQKLGAEFELKLKESNESVCALKDIAQVRELECTKLQEELKLKTETVEHFKVQVEKAKMHYNNKKQLLVEEQEARQALQVSLETSQSELKALKAELKLSSMLLEDAKMTEKNLMIKVKSLETQLDFADRHLREQNKQGVQGAQEKLRESVYLKVPNKKGNTSTDSLELDLDDSLNTTGKPSVPGESSTPLVRSSERLAAKRGIQDHGSRETLYFTPLNPRFKKGAHHQSKLENSITSLGELVLDSTKKPVSSTRTRRTTQVINITMTKKSPGGGGEAEESFYSLHASQSQPNLASQKIRPISMEVFEDPGEVNSSDKLLSLPGYRRSNVHGNAPPRATSTFCVGAEYEPEHVADDWMRIAELQSRNKVCLPHLKSSYPLESRPSLGFSSHHLTDEEVRFGDPEETIRRASYMPGQLADSLHSHRLSLAPPPVVRDHGPSQQQRFTMLPGQVSAGTAAYRASQQISKSSTKTQGVRSTRSPLAVKRQASQLQNQDTPEAKRLASCFPRPATPKGRGLRSTASNSQNRPPSPADRRQSMAFMIDNTPKRSGRVDSRLQRGINKLRNSARKSPAAAARLAQSSAANSCSLVDRRQRKSPRNASTKSPKIPTSAKKLMRFRMKT